MTSIILFSLFQCLYLNYLQKYICTSIALAKERATLCTYMEEQYEATTQMTKNACISQRQVTKTAFSDTSLH